MECTGRDIPSGILRNKCEPCANDKVPTSDGQHCMACVGNSFQNTAKTACETCTGSRVINDQGNGCDECTGNMVSNGNNTNCIPCGGNSVPNDEHTNCQACAGTEVPNNGHTACMECPGNMVPNSQNSACMECVGSAVPKQDRTGCRDRVAADCGGMVFVPIQGAFASSCRAAEKNDCPVDRQVPTVTDGVVSCTACAAGMVEEANGLTCRALVAADCGNMIFAFGQPSECRAATKEDCATSGNSIDGRIPVVTDGRSTCTACEATEEEADDGLSCRARVAADCGDTMVLDAVSNLCRPRGKKRLFSRRGNSGYFRRCRFLRCMPAGNAGKSGRIALPRPNSGRLRRYDF